MKLASFILQPLLVICLFTLSIFAGDMTLVHSGENVILHDNNTWEFENRNAEELEEDFEVTLMDDRIIRVSVDGTWRFVEKSELKAREVLPINHVSGKGTGKNIDLATASAMAMKSALTKATKKLKAFIKGKKLNYNKLYDCVRRVEKDEDSEESFIKGKGWSVTTKIVLDKGSILAVLDCEAEKKEEKKEGKPEEKKETKQK